MVLQANDSDTRSMIVESNDQHTPNDSNWNSGNHLNQHFEMQIPECERKKLRFESFGFCLMHPWHWESTWNMALCECLRCCNVAAATNAVTADRNHEKVSCTCVASVQTKMMGELFTFASAIDNPIKTCHFFCHNIFWEPPSENPLRKIAFQASYSFSCWASFSSPSIRISIAKTWKLEKQKPSDQHECVWRECDWYWALDDWFFSLVPSHCNDDTLYS